MLCRAVSSQGGGAVRPKENEVLPRGFPISPLYHIQVYMSHPEAIPSRSILGDNPDAMPMSIH